MKPPKTLYLVAVLLFIVQITFAQEIQKNQLEVYGKVKVYAQADRASVIFHIKGVGPDLETAFADAKATMNNISAKLDSIGLGQENIATSFFQSSENYGDKAFLSSKKDYRVSMTVTISTERLELLEPIVTKLSECDIERIDDISFELVNLETLKQQALENAVIKAKEKAKLIARQLDIELGGVYSFEEYESRSPNIRGLGSYNQSSSYNAVVVTAQAAGPVMPTIYSQEYVFESKVRVVFEIVNKKDGASLTENADNQ